MRVFNSHSDVYIFIPLNLDVGELPAISWAWRVLTRSARVGSKVVSGE